MGTTKKIKDQPWRNVPGKDGVVYREHPERKHGRKPDRYLCIRYRDANGKRTMEALGWVSQGWSIDKATKELFAIKENIRLGKHPQSLKEKRAMAEEAKAERERLAARAKLQSISFRELAGLYVVWAKANRVTGGEVESILERHVLPEIGDIEAKAITPATVMALYDTVAAKHPLRGGKNPDKNAVLSPQTVLHVIKTVREVFNFALETPVPGSPEVMLFSGANPARISKRGRGVRVSQKDSRRMRVLNDKEREALLAYGGVKPEYSEIRDMILLSLDIGLRAGELCHLRCESVDAVSGAIRILKGSDADRSTKGGMGRIVHAGGIYPECVVMLRRRLAEASGSPYLFPGKDGGRRDHNGLNRAMRRIMEKLKFNDGVSDRQNLVVWHTLRHTYATTMLENGSDVYVLKELMGHASVTTTEGYLHLCDRAKREAALAKRNHQKARRKK